MKKVFLYVLIVLFAGAILCLCIRKFAVPGFFSANLPAPAGVYSYDVVIVGGGASGIAAAIQASRNGSRVAILEETDWIGGQMTAAGVSTMDGNDNFNSGIYKEFTDRVIAYYNTKGKSVHTCYWTNSNICFEPSVGQQKLYEMITAVRSSGKTLDLYLHTRVNQVNLNTAKTKITKVVTSNGAEFFAPVFIEATEFGDILQLSNAAYRAGKGTNISPQPSACVQDITYTAIITKYASSSAMPSGFFMNSIPGGLTSYNQAKQIFATKVTTNGSASPYDYPVNWNVHNAYRGIPDSLGGNYDAGDPSTYWKITKTGVNLANDYPFTVANLSRANRQQAICNAKLRTLQFIYYVQHDLGQPLWSVAIEGYNTAYNRDDNNCTNIGPEFKAIEHELPQMPYVRESVRGIGKTTLTGAQIYREGTLYFLRAREKFPSSIAVGDYAVDLHNCNSQATLEPGESVNHVPPGWAWGPFQIPFNSLVHRDITNLVLAEKNISVTRLANGATRLQPIAMLIGQAAGTIASLLSVPPYQATVTNVQAKLLDAGSFLYGFTDVPATNEYFKAIQNTALKGWMLGDSTSWNFRPDALMTRAELAVTLYRFLGSPNYSPPARATFTDVPTGHWAFKYIEFLYSKGITAGCQTNPIRKYCPDGNLTRAELAVFMARVLGFGTPPTPTSQRFTDVPPSYWAYAYIDKIAVLGVMSAYPKGTSRFSPETLVTRGLMADVLTKGDGKRK